MTERITQKAIARRLGVSQALVSRALSGTAPDIGASTDTVRWIRDMAARMNYCPSAAAQSLRGGRTRTVGVVVRDFEDPFFGWVIGELQTLARLEGYALMLTGSGPSDVEALRKHQPDGLIVIGSDFEPVGLDEVLQTNKPVIQIGAGATRPGVQQIVMDQVEGLRQLTDYLVGLGHSRIGYIGDLSPSNRRRETMVKAALQQRHLACEPDGFSCVPESGAQAGYLAMTRLLKHNRKHRPTAVIASGDALAATALRALYEQRIPVPAALSLAGIDDIPSAPMTIPALTTIRQPIREMAREAFRIMTRQKGRFGCVPPMILKGELVIRESCGPALRALSA